MPPAARADAAAPLCGQRHVMGASDWAGWGTRGAEC
eukprot:gene50333-11777_t